MVKFSSFENLQCQVEFYALLQTHIHVKFGRGPVQSPHFYRPVGILGRVAKATAPKVLGEAGGAQLGLASMQQAGFA
jgi:hypothetical protein